MSQKPWDIRAVDRLFGNIPPEILDIPLTFIPNNEVWGAYLTKVFQAQRRRTARERPE